MCPRQVYPAVAAAVRPRAVNSSRRRRVSQRLQTHVLHLLAQVLMLIPMPAAIQRSLVRIMGAALFHSVQLFGCNVSLVGLLTNGLRAHVWRHRTRRALGGGGPCPHSCRGRKHERDCDEEISL